MVVVAGDAGAESAEASVPLDIPAGSWKSIRLKNIPAGTVITLKLVTDGPVEILLLEEADYARFPKPARPVFRGKTQASITSSVRARNSGDHYVVVDNRSGDALRRVDVMVRAETGTGIEGKPRSTLSADAAAAPNVSLSAFQTKLNELFVFDPVGTRFGSCDPDRSLAQVAGELVLCDAYSLGVFRELGNRDRTRDAVLFLLFHATSHQLLGQWDHPDHANEATADEFAIVLMRMLGQQERTRMQAAYMRENAARFGAIATAFSGDRHSVSPARARNLVRLANDPALLPRWQPMLVPHIQTSILKRLSTRTLSWVNSAVVEKELAKRAAMR